MNDVPGALARAQEFSGFLALLLQRNPSVSALLATGSIELAYEAALACGEGATDMAQALRQRRNALALVTAVADLSGAWDLGRVMRVLSDFADNALDDAIRTAFAERFSDEESRGFSVIALGKLGSRELNYSSDIDPIFIFDPATMPRRAREEPIEAAVRIGRRVVELLSKRDGDGYVVRVDLR
ncbi:MAG: glutamine-synthetase adenylyltransferase, partial [Alphaproteobacteria bacterium]|nr:glutamine-synthetase adenylyltransferase [Alphaproteobacteria bacterium]